MSPNETLDNKTSNKERFVRFNIILWATVLVLYLLSVFIPKMPKQISSH